MNKDEAAQVLSELPEVQNVAVARLNKGDVIVVEANQALSASTIKRIETFLASVWPDNKVVVCEQGMKLSVVRPE